jgi:hypothetical protein
MMKRPSFLDSPYFVSEFNNWHLKPDAPEEVKKDFEKYMNTYNAIHGISPQAGAGGASPRRGLTPLKTAAPPPA